MYAYNRHRPAIGLPVAIAVLAVLVLGVIFQLTRGLPAIAVATTLPENTPIGAPVQIPMPSSGSVAVSVGELGTVVESASTVQRPIASVAKMMTAYVILQSHPLQPGEPGPTLTVTPADEALYLEMILRDESAVPVTTGTVLSELDLLQGLLVPSANNFAEMLAVWDSGSVEAFVARMNAAAQSLGMRSTVYADPSGLSPNTASTAADQLILAEAAMANPVFAAIVDMEEVTIPGSGVFPTTNQILNQEGVIGIKTGFTEEAGGNLAWAARRTVGAEQVDIIGVVLGQPARPESFTVSSGLIQNVGQQVQSVTIIEPGTDVGSLDTAWGDPVPLVVGEGLSLLSWPGYVLQAKVTLDPIKAPLDAGTQVGWVDLSLGEQTARLPVVLGDDLSGAGTFWRLFRF